MQIFQQEYDDGISDTIAANRSLSFVSVVEPLSMNSVFKSMKAIASIKDSDMYYVQSILVSSNWNKNDDIFEPEEIWKSKNTPEHKPTNLNHDEKLIVGHIVSNYPITEDGILIDINTPVENLPKNFHILTGAVIYKAYTDPDLKERTKELIGSIEEGTKYVSMECYFDNFDYGIFDPAVASYKIVARNDDSAYLSKYLRAYGGSGEKDNYKIGRVLRNITFSGKGYVDKPANINSIILQNKLENFDDVKNQQEKNNVFENKGVSVHYIETHTAETCIMSKKEDLKLKAETKEAEAQAVACEIVEVDQLPSETTEVAEMLSLEQVQAELNEKTNVIAELQNKLDEAEAVVKKKMEDEKNMKKKLEETEATMKKMEEEVKSMKKKELMAKRTASLLDCGFSNVDIEESIAAYSTLDDEAFQSVIAVMKKKMAKTEEKVMKKEVKASNEFETTEEILEEVQETEALDLTVGGEDDVEANTTSAALIDFVYSRLGKKLNKGE